VQLHLDARYSTVVTSASDCDSLFVIHILPLYLLNQAIGDTIIPAKSGQGEIQQAQ
jgi:hypothetical protein